ncbi:PBSX family phage terminase large subunit [Tepidimicrobium xylanilyticum]|uniref:Phage terminase, large subunit, PBSX family n=1 Tax=Tepidimicrobium xylanilyticum TaxID=1123352 RepID=A0A1H3F3X8_9FIRM|nr:PBSX family phage terminase large subunit [Tepidimicrobium xylanilyticum]SDX85048.1 phage terminase, large subunit, PBSX family [Tepidimicrobium xylanilyticum]
MKVRLSEVIAPSFYDLHVDIKNNRYTEYMLKGGRGSTKSSFASIEIILGMMRDAERGEFTNAVALRKVKDTLADSVYEQLEWAIDILGVTDEWKCTKSPLQITYLPTGQKILFRGADKPKKIKSTKVKKGYIKYIWYEELDEFYGPEEIRTINQSLMRGGNKFVVFYTYNPPKSSRSWVNQEAKIPKPGRKVHHSDYRNVPRSWLGEVFIVEAEHLKNTNEMAYRHEYLGEEVGTGLEVFHNVTLREITDDEIKTFDRIKQGLDFGYAADPVVFEKMHYDKTRRRLYLFYEFSGIQVSNRKLYKSIKNHLGNVVTVADSAEPKSIAELKSYGMRIKGAIKGPDSVDYGIKFLSEEIEEIIIDPERCPRAAKEFINYSLETDKNGEVKSEYPDKDNHTIDAVRYALEDEMRYSRIEFLK